MTLSKMNNLNFRISSHLKNIIGKELITNKYVAIFELVKNAYDASASKVEVIFENDKIFVKDNGKGMSLDDINNKWLVVGFSAKADNTENDGYSNYRNRISPRKSLAGAKGVGRFACDRLGSKLKLITLKDSRDAQYEHVEIDWDLFEKDGKEDFININVGHETLKQYSEFTYESGTILEVSELREEWTPDEIKKDLSRHLSRLINPHDNENDTFEIYLTYNGSRVKIENFIFEKLNIKTTKITVEISENGKDIITEITDRGERIYQLVEENEFPDSLFGIKFTLFYLSKSAKDFFAKQMGVRTYDYGAISLYRNGFRVFPFGEPGEDSFGLDQRKNQGYARYLGTRDLIGMIEINNESKEFRETSSRSGGLVETMSYKILKDFFKNYCVKRFEAYVIDALDWTYRDEDDTELFPSDREGKIQELLEKLIKTKTYKNLQYGYKFEEKINEKTGSGYKGATEKIKDEAKKTGNKELEKAVKQIEESFLRKTDEIEKANEKSQQLEKQTISLMSLTSEEFDNLISYHHQISICSDTIDNYIDLIFQRIQKNDYSKVEDYLQRIKKENSRIVSIAGFATKNGMKENATKSDRDLINFIRSYIRDNGDALSGGKIKFAMNGDVTPFQFNFRPFDIAVVLDNLIKNSKNSGSRNVSLEFSKNNNELYLVFCDDGAGFNASIDNLDVIFEKKYSTTSGSGWGLFHVRQILDELNSTIIPERLLKGAKFTIKFNKK